MTKIRSAYSGSMPMPLSEKENSQDGSSRRTVTTIRGGFSAAELQRVAEQVLEHGDQQRQLGQHQRQVPGLDGGAGLLDLLGQVGPGLGERGVAGDQAGSRSDRPTLL